MSKKIAIFYTGEPRTIYKTIKYFKNNILINDNYHVFALLQSSNEDENIKKLLYENISNNLKTLNFFDKDELKWKEIREDLLSKINLSVGWKNYLRNSGSMLEYYQLYLAFKDMEKYENENIFYYDYILKIRCDNIIVKPILFDWINYNKEKIYDMLNNIKLKYNFNSIIDYKLISIFMNTLYNNQRLEVAMDFCSTNYKWAKEYSKTDSLKNLFNHQNEKEFIDDFYNYFKDEKYCIIFRTNNIYFMNRKNFEPVHTLAFNYGKYRDNDIEDNYWFNAESQFVKCLRYYNLDVFDSTTLLEDKSICAYDNSNYFDSNNELITNSPNFMFFVCRS